VLEHGGRLRAAARQYAPFCEWSWPTGWTCRPASTLRVSAAGDRPGLLASPAGRRRWPDAAAATYYGNDRLLALPGSQAAIQWLPALFPPVVVAC
jgi:cobalamin biosynthetic protein CobC